MYPISMLSSLMMTRLTPWLNWSGGSIVRWKRRKLSCWKVNSEPRHLWGICITSQASNLAADRERENSEEKSLSSDHLGWGFTFYCIFWDEPNIILEKKLSQSLQSSEHFIPIFHSLSNCNCLSKSHRDDWSECLHLDNLVNANISIRPLIR